MNGVVKDYPRVCGEKFPLKKIAALYLGLPPRMRGKVVAATTAGVATRITPAYAGKSFTGLKINALAEDYPRVCGEKVNIMKILNAEEGLPPRMRGKARKRIARAVARRITPAYAGKSHPDG